MTNLITLAGEGLRFSKKGGYSPKPLIEISGHPMLYRAVKSLPKADKYVFVCRQEHATQYKIDDMISHYWPDSEIIYVSKTTDGQACTAELGINESSIDLNDEILISCCDYGLEWNEDIYTAIKNTSDVVVWSTIRNKAFANNPNAYSWLTVEGTKLLHTSVKQSIFNDPYNHNAIVGTFYFKKAKFFLDSLKTIYEQNITSNGEYYIDNIFNTITNLNVNIFTVDQYHCWGTPEDLEDYENNILG